MIRKINNDPNYWKIRSKTYERTNWVKNNEFLNSIIRLVPPKKYERVLEIGIGTGVVAEKMISKVGTVIGVDLSKEMMACINNSNIYKSIADAHFLPFLNQSIDLIYMRNVLHYLLNTKQVFTEISRCLKTNGLYLFSQVIPYEDIISEEYDWLIDRDIHYPTKSEILDTFIEFDIIHKSEYVLEKQSILNWLNNTCTDQGKKEEIIKRHRHSSNLYKELVNFTESENDIFVNIKHLIILAKKKD
jgi:ubiquinone/menaquinone biosynthesis C-methylase UbiE